MIQTLTRNWRLLALCGVLHAVISVIYLIMQNTDGPLTFHSWATTIRLLGGASLAAGVCTILAGIWRSTNGKSWLLVLNGVALATLGVIQYGFVRYRISFLTVALLIILMAVSIGFLGLIVARTLRRQHQAAWPFTLSGVASFGFAAAFVALGLRWIRIEPGSHTDLLWLGGYFAFSAICMLGLALHLRTQRLSPSLSFGQRPTGPVSAAPAS